MTCESFIRLAPSCLHRTTISKHDDEVEMVLSKLGPACGAVWDGLEPERTLAVALARLPLYQALPLARFNSRPASEPVLWRNWTDLIDAPLDFNLADTVVRDLTGAPATRRRSRGFSAKDQSGRRSLYPEPETAMAWPERMRAIGEAAASPFVAACAAYAEIAISHPYADGNGRLARAVFQAKLGKHGVLSGPHLPLGPLIYANHRMVIEGLVRVGTIGDFEFFFATMAGLVRKAAAFRASLVSS